MKRENYSDTEMLEIIDILLDAEYDLQHVKNLAADLPREFEGVRDERSEAAWEDYQDRDNGEESYRRQMIDAGRGHLLP